MIAQELRLTDQMLGSTAGPVEIVAVVANPLYTSTVATVAFDKQEGLDHLANWSYLTGSLNQLHKVWNDYGVQIQVTPAGAMIAHGDIVYIIDKTGHTREILTPIPGTARRRHGPHSRPCSPARSSTSPTRDRPPRRHGRATAQRTRASATVPGSQETVGPAGGHRPGRRLPGRLRILWRLPDRQSRLRERRRAPSHPPDQLDRRCNDVGHPGHGPSR